MPLIIIIIIIFGMALGGITFFLAKSIIAPKKVAALSSLLKQGKATTVARVAKQIVAKEPRNSEAHYLLALAYQALNKAELALMEFKTVNDIGNFVGVCQEIPFRKKVADLYEQFNQPEEALKEYLLLIKKDPDNADYYFRVGILFEERNRAEKAINFYRKTIELEPRHSMAHYYLGSILFRGKKVVEAKIEFEEAIKFNPENYKAYFYLGRLVKDNHDYVTALSLFEKAQREPEYKIRSLVERGSCYLSMNNIDKAITELERAIKLVTNDTAPETLFARYFLAIAYEKLREIEKAIEQWEAIYTKKPNFRDVAEKLSQYQELRSDDKIKDYLTASMPDFLEVCKAVAVNMGLSIRDVDNVPNGCQIIAVENDARWRNAKKHPKMIWFLRIPEMIGETTVRTLHEEMKKSSITRGMIISSSNFSKKAADYTESRPIDLINRDEFQKLLKNIDFSILGKST